MWTRIFIAALVFMQCTAVLFGIGAIIVLAVPVLNAQAMVLLPAVAVVSVLIAVPLGWWLAPRLRLRSGQSRQEMRFSGR